MTRRVSRRTITKLGAFAGAAMVGVVAGLLSASSGSIPDVAPVVRPLDAIFDPTQPLLIPGSRVPTVQAASISMGFTVPTIRGASPSEVWVSPLTGEAGIRFGQMLVATITQIPSAVDPASVFAQEASDWQLGYTSDLAGQPAWVIPDHPDNPAPGVASVHLAVAGTEVTLYGKMPVDDLVQLAASVGTS
jgi:hypothetical protein